MDECAMVRRSKTVKLIYISTTRIATTEMGRLCRYIFARIGK